ncbi:MFS transporter [Nocardioides zeae]|uniref:MFS transporter n=1 Tax=Nocardioides imazamoxiresistens TaxID=3231893 RepID=A0ABU3PXC8_9ACTN|nr:MFS transporter [Nocardioides zeae]MDT9593898.1 MFS transporter [Nocardioides zeae]
MRSISELLAPARLGPDFRRLLGAFWTANLADGVMLAAGPLLVASLTRDPFLIALGAATQHAGWVAFGLYAGAIADRVDRRLLLMVTNVVRVAVLVVLATAITTGCVSVAWVLLSLLALGIAECFTDTTASTLLPMLVAKRDLGIANARVMVGVMTINQLGGPPLGAALFAAGAYWPVVTQAVFLALVVVQLGRLRLPPRAPREPGSTSLVREVVEGVRWLAGNPPVRTLALAILMFNLTFGATWSILVLYATQQLGLGEIGFGLLTACAAVGGVVGASVYGRLERRFALGSMMRLGLLYETLLHGLLAITTIPAVAGALLVLFGFQASVWGTTSTAVRQRAVPHRMQGRVTSVYLLGVRGGIVVGALAGGALAQLGGVRLTLAVSCVGSALILALIWSWLPRIAHADNDED